MFDKNSKIVVLGAKGMLGTDLMAALCRRGYQPEGLDLPEFDICDDEQLSTAVNHAEAVINCAAYTNVEKAESEPETAYTVNAEAVGSLGRAAAEKGVPVIHISTDFVFDGELDRPYTEEDETNAVSVYGASKLAGEENLLESGAQAFIMRVEWTYGHAGNNFVKKLLELAKQRDSLKVVDDQVGAPTATAEAAGAICRILELDREFPEGIYHFAADGYVSRYEMAKYIFETIGLDTEILPCSSSEFPTAAERPLNSCFDCSKIERLMGEKIKPWQEPLREFLVRRKS